MSSFHWSICFMIQAPWKQKDKNSKLSSFPSLENHVQDAVFPLTLSNTTKFVILPEGWILPKICWNWKPLKHLSGAVPFSFQWFVSDTHCKKKTSADPKESSNATTVKAKSKSQPVSTQHCSTLQHLVWLNPFDLWGVDFCWRIPRAIHTIPNISRMKSCREMQKNLEHQKPTHTAVILSIKDNWGLVCFNFS